MSMCRVLQYYRATGMRVRLTSTKESHNTWHLLSINALTLRYHNILKRTGFIPEIDYYLEEAHTSGRRKGSRKI